MKREKRHRTVGESILGISPLASMGGGERERARAQREKRHRTVGESVLRVSLLASMRGVEALIHVLLAFLDKRVHISLVYHLLPVLRDIAITCRTHARH